jgi:hypothetical protein
MDLILNDNWVDIMGYLSFDIQSLAMTCKSMYLLFTNNKKKLCDIGNYRLSTFQKNMINNICDYKKGDKLLIKNPYNKGNKLAIILSSLKYHGTTIIFTNPSKFVKWYFVIKSLNLKNILILSNEFCDAKKIAFIKKKKYDPSCLDYKILIMPICINTLYHTTHSKIINHTCHYIVHNCITFSRQLNPIVLNNTIYETIYYDNEIKPVVHYKNYHCYRNESVGDIYLDPLLKDDRCLYERLYEIYQLFTDYNFLLVQEDDDPLYNNDSIKYVINYNDLFNHYSDYLINKTHIIFLWPGHQDLHKMNLIYTHIENISTYHIYVYNIHSTIEEDYLKLAGTLPLSSGDIKLLKNKRKKLKYLIIIRNLLEKYGDKLKLLPNYYFSLLMTVRHIELYKVYDMIETEFKNK